MFSERAAWGDGGGDALPDFSFCLFSLFSRQRARGGLNPCARESKARTGRFLREKLISDHGHFSSYEGHMERRTGKIRGAFSRMHRALDGWMLARAPASPVQGLHHHVCVCVFSSHPFWTSSSLDVPAGVTQEEGHTGFLIHLPSAVRALIFVARRIQPFLSLVDREVEFCVLTN